MQFDDDLDRLTPVVASGTYGCMADPLGAALTVTEVAELLKLHPSTVREWAREGRLKPLDLPGRVVRFSRADVERLLIPAPSP